MWAWVGVASNCVGVAGGCGHVWVWRIHVIADVWCERKCVGMCGCVYVSVVCGNMNSSCGWYMYVVIMRLY